MKTVIFHTQEAVFEFTQKEVQEHIELKFSAYHADEANKLLNLISTGNQETITIPEEPAFFDLIALDLIGTGKGSVLCKTCNKTYQAKDLNPTTIGAGECPIAIKREGQGLFKRLFSRKRKPPSMFGGKGYECPEGHSLISVITWKTF